MGQKLEKQREKLIKPKAESKCINRINKPLVKIIIKKKKQKKKAD